MPKAPEKILVFVEVKTVQRGSSLEPEMQMTAAKIKKLKRTASLYTGAFPEKIDGKAGWRIDLLALTIKEKDCLINHYENI